MRASRRPLLFNKGFVGPDWPHDQIAGACIDMQNVCLTPDGSSLRPFPGYQVLYPYELVRGRAYINLNPGDPQAGWLEYHTEYPPVSSYNGGELYEALPAGLRVVCLPAEAIGARNGRVIAIADEVNGRPLAVGFHPGGQLMDPALSATDRVPLGLLRLNRFSAHDYPTILNHNGRTHICTPYDEQWLWDGGQIRRAGIRPPQRAPIVRVAETEQAEGDIPGAAPSKVAVFRIEHIQSPPNSDPRVEISRGIMKFRLWDSETNDWTYDDTVNPADPAKGNESGVIDLGSRYTNTFSEVLRVINTSPNWDAELLKNRTEALVTAPGIGSNGNNLYVRDVTNTLSGGLDAQTARQTLQFSASPDFQFDEESTDAVAAWAYAGAPTARMITAGPDSGKYWSNLWEVTIDETRYWVGAHTATAPSAAIAAALAAMVTKINDLRSDVVASVATNTFGAGNLKITAATAGAAMNGLAVNDTTLKHGADAVVTPASGAVRVTIWDGANTDTYRIVPDGNPNNEVGSGEIAVYNNNGSGDGSVLKTMAALEAAINDAARTVAVTATKDDATYTIGLAADVAGAGGEDINASVQAGAADVPLIQAIAPTAFVVTGEAVGAKATGVIWPRDWGWTGTNEADLEGSGTTGQPGHGDTLLVGAVGGSSETYKFHTGVPFGAPNIDVEIGADLDETIGNLVAAIHTYSAIFTDTDGVYAGCSQKPLRPPEVHLADSEAAAVDESPGNDTNYDGLTLHEWTYELIQALNGGEWWRGSAAADSPSEQPDFAFVSPGLWDYVEGDSDTAAGVPDAVKNLEVGASDGSADCVHIWLREGMRFTGNYEDLAYCVTSGTVPGSSNEDLMKNIGFFASLSLRTKKYLPGLFTALESCNLALVFDATADFTGTDSQRVVIRIPPRAESAQRTESQYRGTWLDVSGVLGQLVLDDGYSYPNLLSDSGFSYLSIGIRLLSEVPARAWDTDVLPNPGQPTVAEGEARRLIGYATSRFVQFSLDNVYFQDPETVSASPYLPPATSLPNKLEYAFCFSWIISAERMESAPSPAVQVEIPALIDEDGFIQDRQAVNLDIAGFLSGLEHDMENNPQYPNIDRVAVYISAPSWDADTGVPQFHLLDEFPIDYLSFVTAEGGPTAARQYNIHLAMKHVDDVVLQSREPYYTNGIPPGAQVCTVDGERMLWAGVPDYSVGRISYDQLGGTGLTVMRAMIAFENADGDVLYFKEDDLDSATGLPTQGVGQTGDGYTIRRNDLTPTFAPHLEGRTVRIVGTTQRGLVRKVMRRKRTHPVNESELPWDGTYNRLWVDGIDLAEGAEIEDVKYVIEGAPTRLYYSIKNTRYGASQEFCNPFGGWLDLDMPGDEIVALGHVGDFVCVVGRKYTVYLLQDTTTFDNVPGSGAPFPNQRRFQGGCISGRTFVEIPGGEALWLSPEGQLMRGTVAGVTPDPLSVRFTGWIGSQFRVTQALLKHAHAVYIPETEQYVLFVPKSSEGAFAYWPNRPEPGAHEEWSTDATPAPVEIPFWEQII